MFYGVLGNPLVKHDVRGWLLHFDPELTKAETPGSFGWDQSVSVVPVGSVPSYQGNSSYLLVSKYNNYAAGPTATAATSSPCSTHTPRRRTSTPGSGSCARCRTVLSPRHPPHTPAGERFEWCVNSVAVDPATGSAMANNEDGHLYRWDLDTGKLVEQIRLNSPHGQAYTMTVVGPDGTTYAIENAILYAVGS